MKKAITISVKSPEIITNPPGQDIVDINIEGLETMEAVLLLSSILAQLSARELPQFIEMIKQAKEKTHPIPVLSKA